MLLPAGAHTPYVSRDANRPNCFVSLLEQSGDPVRDTPSYPWARREKTGCPRPEVLQVSDETCHNLRRESRGYGAPHKPAFRSANPRYRPPQHRLENDP